MEAYEFRRSWLSHSVIAAFILSVIVTSRMMRLKFCRPKLLLDSQNQKVEVTKRDILNITKVGMRSYVNLVDVG